MARTFIGYIKYTPTGFRKVIHRTAIGLNGHSTASDSKAEADNDAESVVNWVVDLLENHNTLRPTQTTEVPESFKNDFEELLTTLEDDADLSKKNAIKVNIIDDYDHGEANYGPAIEFTLILNGEESVSVSDAGLVMPGEEDLRSLVRFVDDEKSVTEGDTVDLVIDFGQPPTTQLTIGISSNAPNGTFAEVQFGEPMGETTTATYLNGRMDITVDPDQTSLVVSVEFASSTSRGEPYTFAIVEVSQPEEYNFTDDELQVTVTAAG